MTAAKRDMFAARLRKAYREHFGVQSEDEDIESIDYLIPEAMRHGVRDEEPVNGCSELQQMDYQEVT